MRDVHWRLLENSLFQVYYTEGADQIAYSAMDSLAEGYPYISRILGSCINNDAHAQLAAQDRCLMTSSFNKVTIILGDRFETGGFANPIGQNIEALVMQSRQNAFLQHELVHRLMYEHNDFHIGPLGRVFSLAMMPTWWIEGLAEYLTESVGSIETNALERNMALEGTWPTWDHLHSLYHSDDDVTTRGYVTSGRFLGWIFKKSQEKDLFKVQEQIAKKTVIPPFYNAVNSWLNQNLGESGKTLYNQFQMDKKKDWMDYLNQMPGILDSSSGKALVSKNHGFDLLQIQNQILISNLISHDVNPEISSAFFVTSLSSDLDIRLPVSLSGSSLFALDREENGTLLTADLKRFPNATFGHVLRSVSFSGSIFQLKNENILHEELIPFSTNQKQYLISQIKNAGSGFYFIVASLHGNTGLYLFNLNDHSMNLLKEYSYPATVKIIESSRLENSLYCATFILNQENTMTSLDKICSNSVVTKILPSRKLNIQDGYYLKNGSFRLLVSCDKLLGLVDYHHGKINSIAAFPEWVTRIYPDENDDNYFLAIVYKDGKYELNKIDRNKLKENFFSWKQKQDSGSVFQKEPTYIKYTPPFVRIYNEMVKEGVFKESMDPAIKSQDDKTVLRDDKTTLRNDSVPAKYDNTFLFAYPYALPAILGGPSINLVATPIIDKMERYRVQISAGYHFYLQAPNGSISYINNRFLDKFSVTLYSQPFFNGFYDTSQITNNVLIGRNRTYNYLDQIGVSVFGVWNFQPSSFVLQNTLTLSQITPYPSMAVAPVSVGAQTASLASLVGKLSFHIFDTGIYLAKASNPNGRYLIWKTFGDIGAGKFNSLNNATDSSGNDAGPLDYYNINAKIISTFSAYFQKLSLIGKISTTQGAGTFNLKEFYSPYQMYILGSTESLNRISFPIINNSSLFDLQMGYWSYSGMINYDFPIYPSFESTFLMSYIDKWRGFLGLMEGGVFTTSNLSSATTTLSGSVGTSISVDVKGFQFYPSLIYSSVLGGSGWSILAQIKVMDIF